MQPLTLQVIIVIVLTLSESGLVRGQGTNCVSKIYFVDVAMNPRRLFCRKKIDKKNSITSGMKYFCGENRKKNVEYIRKWFC